MAVGNTSPTLTLRVQSTEAQTAVEDLNRGLRTLHYLVASFNGKSLTGDSVGKLKLQVNELSQALKTSEASVVQLQQKLDTQSSKGVQAIKAETDALQRNRDVRNQSNKEAVAGAEALRRANVAAAEQADRPLRRLVEAERRASAVAAPVVGPQAISPAQTSLALMTRLRVNDRELNALEAAQAQSFLRLRNLEGARTSVMAAERAAYREQLSRNKTVIAEEAALRNTGLQQIRAQNMREAAERRRGIQQIIAAEMERRAVLRAATLNTAYIAATPARQLAIASRAAVFSQQDGVTPDDVTRRYGAAAAADANTAAIDRLILAKERAAAESAKLARAQSVESAALKENAAAARANAAAHSAGFTATVLPPSLVNRAGAGTLAPPVNIPTSADEARVLRHAVSTRELAGAQRELHSAARGLSGALGGLWLTYGSTVPIVAGFAIAGALREAVKAGAEFQYQMTFVKQISEASSSTMVALSEAVLGLSSRSLYAPLELAEGMRVLAQAGFSATESFAALPAVMDLATVGELKMEDAALTLAGAMNAFGLTVKDIPHIGDVLAKAAAVSQTSVKALMESLRQASTIAEQYSQSLETVTVGLVQLAKVNIIGSAAGTSAKNFYADLAGRTPKQLRAQEELGVSFFDETTGQTKDALVVINELREALKPFTEEAQFSFFSDLFTQRSVKQATAFLRTPQTDLEAERKQYKEESDGFMRLVAVELETTAKGEFKKAASAFSSAMIRAFDESEGALKNLALTLREVFSSSEFKSGVDFLLSSLAGLTEVIIENGRWLTYLLGLYAGVKILSGVTSIVTTAAAAFSQLSIAQKSASAAALTSGLATNSVPVLVQAARGLSTTAASAGLATTALASTGVAAALTTTSVASLVGSAKQGRVELNGLASTEAPKHLNAIGGAANSVGIAMGALTRGLGVFARFIGIGGVIYIAVQGLIELYDRLAGAKNRAAQESQTQARTLLGGLDDQVKAVQEDIRIMEAGYDPDKPDERKRGLAVTGIAKLKEEAAAATAERTKAQEKLESLRAQPGDDPAILLGGRRIAGGAVGSITATQQTIADAQAKFDFADANATEAQARLKKLEDLQKYREFLAAPSFTDEPPDPESALTSGTRERAAKPDGAGAFAAKQASKLASAQGSDLLAQFRQKEQVIDQFVKSETEVLDVQKRFNLIREEEYAKEIDRLTEIRMNGLVEIARGEEAFLKSKIAEGNLLPDAQQRLETQLSTAQARKARAEFDAFQNNRVRDVRLEGQQSEREKAVAVVRTGAESDIRKITEKQELSRQTNRADFESTFESEAVTIRKEAFLQTEKAFLNEKEQIIKQIAQFEEKGDATSKAKAEALRGVLPLLEEQKKVQSELNATEAESIYAQSRTFETGIRQSFEAYKDSATDSAKAARDAFTFSVNTMEDALAEFATTGKVNFKSLSDTIIAEMARIAAKMALSEIFEATGIEKKLTGASSGGSGGNILGQIGSGVAGLFGFGGSKPTGAYDYSDDATIPLGSSGTGSGGSGSLVSSVGSVLGSIGSAGGSIFSSIGSGISSIASIFGFHTGGIIGQDRPGSPRSLSAAAFVGAPRLHAGGVVGTDHRGPRLTTPLDLIGATRMHVGGLAMNEMPAILERGEGVFTPAQMSKLAPAQSTNNSKATTNNNSVNVSVNVPPSMDRASAQQLASMVGAKTQKAMRSIL